MSYQIRKEKEEECFGGVQWLQMTKGKTITYTVRNDMGFRYGQKMSAQKKQGRYLIDFFAFFQDVFVFIKDYLCVNIACTQS